MRIFFILILFLMTSCAGIKPVRPKKRYQVDADVEKTFEELEKEKILDYYFQLRMRDLKNKKSASKKPKRTYQKRERIRIFEPARPKPRVASPPPRKPKILVDPKENQIRMEQMLSFHCIKKRDSNNCKQVTKAIEENCRSEFDLDDQRLIRCIEKKLSF